MNRQCRKCGNRLPFGAAFDDLLCISGNIENRIAGCYYQFRDWAIKNRIDIFTTISKNGLSANAPMIDKWEEEGFK